jgi:hypothetical protein
MQEALIILQKKAMVDVERAIKAIEALDGRVLHSYPPRAIIASIPPEKISELQKQAEIASVDTEEIEDERLKTAAGAIHPVIAAWNEHVRKQRRATAPADSSIGLSWDDPSRLPPDPPPDVQEMLRRREREMEEGE